MRAPSKHLFRTVATEAKRWSTETRRRLSVAPIALDARTVDWALETFTTPDVEADWLANQDVHGGNILAAQRQSWLLIDPKPLVGEREIDAVGLLRNAAWRECVMGVRAWLSALTEVGLDRERMRAWGVAHAIAWGWDDAAGWSSPSIDAARTIAAA